MSIRATIQAELELVRKGFDKAAKQTQKEMQAITKSSEQMSDQVNKSSKEMISSFKAAERAAKGLGSVFRASVGFVIAEVVGEAAKALKRLTGDLLLTSRATPAFVTAFTNMQSGVTRFLDSLGQLITNNPLAAQGFQLLADALIGSAKWLEENRVAIILLVGNGLNLLIRATNFVIENIDTIKSILLGSIVAWTVWKGGAIAAAIATGGFGAAIGAATIAVRAFFVALGPLGLAALAIGYTVAKAAEHLGVFGSKTDEAKSKTIPLIDMVKLEKDAHAATTTTIEKNTKAREDNIKAIENLKEALAKAKMEAALAAGAIIDITEETESYNEILRKVETQLGDIVMNAGLAAAVQWQRDYTRALSEFETAQEKVAKSAKNVNTETSKIVEAQKKLNAAREAAGNDPYNIAAAYNAQKAEKDLAAIKASSSQLDIESSQRVLEAELEVSKAQKKLFDLDAKRAEYAFQAKVKHSEDLIQQEKDRVKEEEKVRKEALEKAQQEAEEQVEYNQKILKERLSAEKDYAEMSNDINRIKGDEQLSSIEKAFGLEETLRFLSLQRQLEMEGKKWEATQMLAKKAAEAQSKILLDSMPDEIEFGDTPIAKFFTDIGKGLWAKMPDGLKDFINGAMEIFGYFIEGVKLAFQGLSYTVDVLSGEWINQFTDVVSKLGEMPFNFFESFKNLDETINHLLGPDGISKAIFQIINQLPHIINQIVENFPKLVDKIIEAIPHIADALVDAMQKMAPLIADAIPKIIQALVDALPKITKALADSAPAFIGALMDGLTSIVEKLPEILQPLIESIPKIVETFLQKLPALITAIFDAIPKIVRDIVKMLPGLVEAIAENLPDIITSFIEGIGEAIPEIIEALIDELLVKGGLERIIKALIRAMPRIAQALVVAIWHAFLNIVQGIGDAIWNAIKAAFDKDNMSEWGAKISDGWKKAMDTSLLGKWGAMISDGWKNSFGKWFEEAGAAIWKGFLAPVGVWFRQQGKRIWDGFLGPVGDFFQRSGKNIWEAFSNVGDWFARAGSTIWNSFIAPVGEWFAEAGKKIWEGFLLPIGNFFGDMGTQIWNGFLMPIGTFFGDMGTQIWTGFIAPVGEWFAEAGKKIWSGLESLGPTMTKFFGDLGTSIWNGLFGNKNSLMSFMGDAGTAIWKGLFGEKNSLISMMGDAGTAIWNAAKDLFSKPGAIFSNLGSGIWDKFKALVEKPGDLFKNLGKNIWDALKDGLGGIGNIFKDAINAINPSNLLQKLFKWDGGGRGTVENALGIDIPWVSFAQGGIAEVPGTAKVRGDHPANDTIPAILSPGEMVLKRTIAQDPEFRALLAAYESGRLVRANYGWDDFKGDVGGLDPTVQPWWPDIPGVGKLDPWQYVKDNIWSHMRKGLGLFEGGVVPQAQTYYSGGTVSNMSSGGSIGNTSVTIDYDQLAAAMANVNLTTYAVVSNMDIGKANRAASKRGLR